MSKTRGRIMKILVLCLIAACSLSYVESVELHCVFMDIDGSGYRCFVQSLTITSKNNRTITEVIGEHEKGRTNDDVVYLFSILKTIRFIPLEVGTFFKNLETIRISMAGLRGIESSDFEQFGGKLKKIAFDNNAIQVLEADLFQFNPNLESIDFNTNKIVRIEDGAFDGLYNLTSLYLNDNPCTFYEDEYSWTDVVSLTIKNIKKAYEKCQNDVLIDEFEDSTTEVVSLE